jgi:hypothetical protein
VLTALGLLAMFHKGFWNGGGDKLLRMTYITLLSDWLTAHAAAVQALSSVASVILAGILVWTTIRYARSTAEILEESRKSREAIELQAKAAQSQSSASQAQASAAFESIALVREQLEDQLGLGRSVIHSAIDRAVSAISYWKERPLADVAKAPGLPPSDNLIPPNASAAVEHARRNAPQVTQELSSAFDDLRNARNEIERIRLLSKPRTGLGFLEQTQSKAPEYLDSAFKKLQRVKAAIPWPAA